jgi:hypothetical protein
MMGGNFDEKWIALADISNIFQSSFVLRKRPADFTRHQVQSKPFPNRSGRET